MIRLTPGDLQEIEKLAITIAGKSAMACPEHVLNVGGKQVPVRTVMNKDHSIGEVLGHEEMRGHYGLDSREIQINCGGVTLPNDARSIAHIVRLLAHEATHAIQRDQFPEPEITKAKSTAEIAAKDKSTASYLSYATSAVELPGHACMIAADVEQSGLSYEEFEALAKSSWSYTYISEKIAGTLNIADSLTLFIREAYEAHKVMRP
jgi:hypothetical protein